MRMGRAIDRDSPIPIYYQIALDLRQRITSGEWRAGNKLPPEPELAGRYGVSRMTLRQGMAELVEDGLLVRRRGDGTFVNWGYLDVAVPREAELPIPLQSEIDKASLRHEVWEELRPFARPDSRFHWDFSEFVPDFEGSERCATKIWQLDSYQQSRLIFAAPDNSLTAVRQQAIVDGKSLVVATHGISRGFVLLESGVVTKEQAAFAATLDGVERFGRPLSLSEISELGTIDLLITGVSLVTEKGVRWGKGHGYFDLEWGMFRQVGAVDESTPVIAVGHECQVVAQDLRPSFVDAIVDMIVTPARVISVERPYTKPKGILWHYVSPDLIDRIPPLQALFDEQQADGRD